MIRKAKEGDISQCTKLAAIPELQSPDGTFIPASYIKSCLEQNAIAYVAEVEKKVVGFVLGEPLIGNGAMLHFIAVLPNQQGKGLGRELVSAFEDECKQRNIEWIFLVSSAMNNTPKFYTKLGYDEGKKHIAFMKNI